MPRKGRSSEPSAAPRADAERGEVSVEAPGGLPTALRGAGEPFKPVRRESLASRVSQALISAILRGELPAGEFLPSEEVLCQRFEVSRPVAREAIKVLANVGMARTRQGQGSVVLDESNWNEFAPEVLVARCETGTAEAVIAEVIELRAVLEARAAELAIERLTPADLTRLREHLRAMEDSLDSQERFLAYDLAFHREIVSMAGNRLVLKLFELLEPMLLAARVVALEHQRLPDGMVQGIDEHRAIVEAMANGASDKLRQAVMQHLSWVRDRVGKEGGEVRDRPRSAARSRSGGAPARSGQPGRSTRLRQEPVG